MAQILPQQRLLLELLIMSGDIAVSSDIKGTILKKTLQECQNRGWIKSNKINNEFQKEVITNVGRRALLHI